MVTIEQAKKAALDFMGAGLEISEASELPDKWVFSFRNRRAGRRARICQQRERHRG